jgi:hypothetical protein
MICQVAIFSSKQLSTLMPTSAFSMNNEELHNLYSSPNIIRMIKSRRMRWAGHAARMGEKGNAYRILMRKTKGRRPLGRPRRRWVHNTKMDLKEIGRDSMVIWPRIGTGGGLL